MNSIFEERAKKHDELENEIMGIVRPFTDRKHLPDRRVSFGGVPCSFDVKTTIFVEDNSHDEYFRLWNEGEPVFIVYQITTSQLYADWIINISWAGPFPPSKNSTCGDPYYRIDGGRGLNEFLNNAEHEIVGWISLRGDQ